MTTHGRPRKSPAGIARTSAAVPLRSISPSPAVRSATPDPGGLLALQRVVGNRAVNALLNRLSRQDGAAQRAAGARASRPGSTAGPAGQPTKDPGAIHAAAAEGISGRGGPLPYLDPIQRSFGRHDVSDVVAHTDDEARTGARTMGAAAFAMGDHVAFADQPSLHTAAHEAAHVIQQRGGVRLHGGVGTAGDAYEQHADAVADRVVAGQSAVDLLGVVNPMSAWQVAIQRKPSKQHGFEAEPVAEPHAASLETGQTIEIKLSIRNVAQAHGVQFFWGGGTHDPRVLAFNRIEQHGHGKATLSVTAVGAGSTIANGTVEYGDQTRSVDIPVTVSSDAARSAQHLANLRERRKDGQQVSEDEQVGAEHDAVAGAETLVARAHGGHGTEVSRSLGRILEQIGVIQHSREIGYLAALDELNAKGLDKQADYGAFGQSLAGNLLWALSGVIPGGSLGVLAVRGLRAFFAARWAAPSPGWAAAVGTIGAMMAQFSSIPSGSNTSALKIQMRRALSTINSQICNALRRAAPEIMAEAVANQPPSKDDNATAYAADLELGTKHLLYGQIYADKLNDGDLVDGAKVQEAARLALLRQYIVANAALDDDGNLTATKAMADQTQVGDALDLVGGPATLNLQPYELIWNQVQTAATDLGCTVAFDRALAARLLSEGKDVAFPVTSFDVYRAFGGGSPTHWMNPLMTRNIVRPDPEFSNEAYLSNANVTAIIRVTVRKADLTHAVIGGKHVYSANRVRFTAAAAPSRGFISVSPPPTFDIVYEVAP